MSVEGVGGGCRLKVSAEGVGGVYRAGTRGRVVLDGCVGSRTIDAARPATNAILAAFLPRIPARMPFPHSSPPPNHPSPLVHRDPLPYPPPATRAASTMVAKKKANTAFTRLTRAATSEASDAAAAIPAAADFATSAPSAPLLPCSPLPHAPGCPPRSSTRSWATSRMTTGPSATDWRAPRLTSTTSSPTASTDPRPLRGTESVARALWSGPHATANCPHSSGCSPTHSSPPSICRVLQGPAGHGDLRQAPRVCG